MQNTRKKNYSKHFSTYCQFYQIGKETYLFFKIIIRYFGKMKNMNNYTREHDILTKRGLEN